MCRCGPLHFSESRFANEKKCRQLNATPSSVDEEGVGVFIADDFNTSANKHLPYFITFHRSVT